MLAKQEERSLRRQRLQTISHKQHQRLFDLFTLYYATMLLGSRTILFSYYHFEAAGNMHISGGPVLTECIMVAGYAK
jgi:hypothetical protein